MLSKISIKTKPKQTQSGFACGFAGTGFLAPGNVRGQPWPCFHGLEAHATFAQDGPKQISKMPKMNASVLTTMDYGENPAFAKNRNKAKTKPILRLRSGQAKANLLAPGNVRG